MFVFQETPSLPNSLGKRTINEKLTRILNEKREQVELISKLKSEPDVKRVSPRLAQKQLALVFFMCVLNVKLKIVRALQLGGR